jgi:hypothetical protein
MRNVIGQFKNNIMCKFDLKGSTQNRKTEFEIDSLQRIVLKDLNFEEIEKYLLMNKVEVERLRFNCKTDAFFLSDMEIMDYSLFVVKLTLNNKEIESIFGKRSSSENSIKSEEINILNGSQNNTINQSSEVNEIFANVNEIQHYRKYLYRSLNKNIVYIISIIDYLQIYNFWKFIETKYKYNIHERPDDIKALSCVPPDIYCTRFIDFVDKITEIDEKKINKIYN